MRLSDLLTVERIDAALSVRDKSSAIDALARLLAPGADGIASETIARVLREREQLASTGVGDEVAIPHGKLPGLRQLVAAIALVPKGVEFESIDGKPVRIVVAILSPERSASDHLRALARCSKLLRDPRIRGRLLEATTPSDILAIVREESGAIA